ncbi:MAG: helix-turn-helix transcriptional regulator [Clostridia bacterium]|nr:helix-turn-helix transcriptional regulator [Clostridia bacterium]
MDIGKRIIELRQKKNISTNKLANEAGISQSYLREIEMGLKNPTVEMLSYLCYALGVSLKDFFSEDKEQIQPFLLSALEKLNPQEQLKLAEFINEMKKD